MAFTMTQFGGHQAFRLEAGEVSVFATTSVGPRILGLVLPDGRNALVELPTATLPCPGSGLFRLYGGHRLWAAPEDPRVTYRPDDAAVGIEELPDGVTLTAPADPVAGTQRILTIRVTGPGRLTIVHQIENQAAEPQRLAAWAITQVPPGGRAWLPLLTRSYDPGGFQAQRNVVLWPYSRLDDPRLVMRDAYLEVRTDRLPPGGIAVPVKVGTSLRRGWLAHWRDGILFVKRALHQDDRLYADMGASAQVFANADFQELETLSPLVDLAPGETVEHVEEWQVELVDEAEAERRVTSGELDR